MKARLGSVIRVLAVGLLACFAPLVAQDGIDARAFVALEAPTAPVVVGQAVEVRVQIGLEQELATKQLIQLFRQKLDVAVRLDTPWAELPEGLVARGVPPGFEGKARAVVDGSLAGLRRLDDEVRGERTFLRYETAVRLLPERSGRFELAAPVLHFAWASAFDEDFFGDPVPRDRNDARIEGEALVIEVEALPAEGRPAGFSGLVGRFTWTAVRGEGAADLRVGDVLPIEFTLAGEGDLSGFTPPEWRAGAFHGRGVREIDAAAGTRAFRYELIALRAGDVAVPGFSLSVFEPGVGYRQLSTEAIPLRVAPRADGVEAIDAAGQPVAIEAVPPVPDVLEAPVDEVVEAAPIPGVDVLFAPRAVEARRVPPADFAAPRPLSRVILFAGLLLPWLFAAGLWLLRRRAATREVRRLDARRRDARSRFRRDLRNPRADRGHALARYLAAWLDCEPAAVIDPELPQRLRLAGVDPATADQLDAHLDALARARFGGERTAPDDRTLRGVVEVAERDLRRSLPVTNPWPGVLVKVALVVVIYVLAVRWNQPPGDERQAPTAPSATSTAEPASPVDDPDRSADPSRALDDLAAGDPAAAHAEFLACLDQGLGNPADLAFDLGNCAHVLGRPAESVLWFRRALRLAPRDFEARANLALVEHQLGRADGPLPTLGRTWLDGQLAWLTAIRPGRLLGLAVLLQVIGWWLALRSRRRAVALVLLLLGLAATAIVALQSLRGPIDQAVILRADVRLLAEPHTRAAARGSLEAGETIEWLEASPRWVRARTGSTTGWIEAAALEPLTRAP